MEVREERLRGSLVRRWYRAPGYGYASWESHGIGWTGAVALSAERLVVSGHGNPFVDVDLCAPWPAGIAVCAPRPGRLVVGVDAVRYLGATTGTAELRLRTDHAEEIVHALGHGRIGPELSGPAVFAAEELPGSIRFRGLREHGALTKRRVEVTTAAVAVTADRLLVWTGRDKHVDVPIVAGRPTGIEVRRRRGAIALSYVAERFSAARSGRVEIRLLTDRAADLLAALAPRSAP